MKIYLLISMTKSKNSKFTSKQNRQYLNNIIIQDYKNIINSDSYYSFDVPATPYYDDLSKQYEKERYYEDLLRTYDDNDKFIQMWRIEHNRGEW